MIHIFGSWPKPSNIVFLNPSQSWDSVDDPASLEPLIEIIRRDALADVSEQDKELLWKLRYVRTLGASKNAVKS